MLERGYHVIPVEFRSKKPVGSRWQNNLYTVDDLDRAFPQGSSYGIGLLTGTEVRDRVHLVAIDVDVDDPVLISRIRHSFRFRTVFSAKKGMKGITFFVRTSEPLKKDPIKKYRGESKARVELLGKGQYTVLPPSLHPQTNDEYEWVEGDPLDEIDPESLPEFLPTMIDEIRLAIEKPEAPLFSLNDMVWSGPGGGGSVHDSVLGAVGQMVQRNWTNEDITRRVNWSVERVLYENPMAPRWDARQFDIDFNAMVRGARDKGFDKAGPRKGGNRNDKLLEASFEFISTIGGQELMADMGGVFRVYSDGWWKELSRNELARRVKAMSSVRSWATASDALSIADTIMMDAPIWNQPSRDMVATHDGAIDLTTGERMEHSPDYGLTYCLPFDYDPMARCPVYDSFVVDVFSAPDTTDEDRRRAIDLFDEYAGLTFVDDATHQKSLIMIGPTNSGKSTLMEVMRNVHPPSSQCTLDLFDLRSERTTSALAGKLVSFTPEISADDIVPADVFKMIVDGSTVSTRRLYAEKMDVTMKARLVIACNEMFRYRDGSGAMERRMLPLKARNTVPEDQRDRTLVRRMLGERPGIFARWTRGLMRLRDRRDFLMPSYGQSVRDESFEASSPVKAWMRDKTHEGWREEDADHTFKMNGGTESSQLFQSFMEWSKNNGHKQMSVVTWGTRMVQMGYPCRVVRVGKRIVRVRDLHLVEPRGAAEGDY